MFLVRRLEINFLIASRKTISHCTFLPVVIVYNQATRKNAKCFKVKVKKP